MHEQSSARTRLPLVWLPLDLPAPAMVAGEGTSGAFVRVLRSIASADAALDGNPARDRWETRLFARPIQDTGVLLACLRAAAGASAGAPPARAPDAYDTYLGIRRAALPPERAAAEAVGIVYRALADVRHAFLEVNHLLAELRAIAALLRRHVRLPDPPPAPLEAAHAVQHAASAPREAPEGDGVERWILGHHLYGVLNRHAAAAIERAIDAFATGDRDAAARELRDATLFVRGFTAAMIHAGCMPAAYYCAVVRPTMVPPACPVHLSGAMNPDHGRHRAAVAKLLSAMPQSFSELARTHLELALARDALLDADLLDLEEHTTVAAKLVGNDHALSQDAHAPDNAVTTLRRMRLQRAAAYQRYLQFADSLVAE